MNILELDSYNLADAVKFHNRLNPKLWGGDEHLLPQVREKLLAIAADFQEFLGVENLGVEDITLSGSNAAYSYTPNSDIDLHLVVKMPSDPVYQELFNAKKYQYNNEHNIKIGGADVELYVQPADQPHHSQGIYSVKDRKWIAVPRRRRAKVDDACVRDKVADLDARIHDAVKQGDEAVINTLWQKIKQMRQAGLAQHGEFGCENIAFKLLRNSGCIKLLKDALNAARDRGLSMAEARKKNKKKKVKYGFGGYWAPGFSFSDSGEGGGDGGGGESRFAESPDGVNPSTKSILEEPVDESPDGVNPTTAMFLTENDIDIVLSRFFNNCIDFLGIENAPEMVLHHNTDWSESTGSFGQFDPDNNLLHLATSGRHVLDILRTMAHELTHCRQNELQTLPDDAGGTGSPWEDEANAMAGRIMRHWADKHPEMFRDVSLEESASGYIPKNKKQARDPRYSMALTVDIKPGQVGREANKLALDTDSQGKPALLMKTVNLREGRMPQPSQGPGQYRELNQPLGPETPPTMPAGTVRVDVSDVYDWYKLGQHISNMKGLGKHDFGKGPPSAIISFGDEETEHKFIKDLKATGLDVTDIDPKDPQQPAGMRKIKTDPTYNVDEEDDLVESLRREFELLEDEVLGEIRMSPSNLRQEAAKTGARAGMEFEMVVPNVDIDNGDGVGSGDPEPDWNYNESVGDIEDAVRFFDDGEYNGGREIADLREEMTNQYYEWLEERREQQWKEDVDDYVRDWLWRTYEDEWRQEAEQQILDSAPEFGVNDEELRSKIEELVQEKHDAALDGVGSSDMDAAYEEWSEEFNENAALESEWLESEGIETMRDVLRNYDVNWPHWVYPETNTAIDSVGDDFEAAIGRPVNTSSSYSQGRREAGHYVVEPDGSIEADDDNDAGLEFVSPPLPIDQMLSDLNKVKAWATSRGCYTNSSTGLHINISVPGYSQDRLDFVKLALLMGDQYVLDTFGRSSNSYCESALKIVKDRVKQDPNAAQSLLNKMRGHMEDLASKAIHSGETGKYTSINTKEGWIEFRSPGGDWLNENFDQIENTLLRFTVAMSAALDPEAYREEYQKKLYKLLSKDSADTDTIQYFTKYAVGDLPQQALKSFVRQAQLQRSVAKGKQTGAMWWNVEWENTRSIEVVASNAQEAIAAAVREWGIHPMSQAAQSLRAKPLRPYQGSAPKSAGPTVNGRPSNPDGSYVIVRNRASVDDPIAYRFMAADAGDADTVLLQWSRENPGEWQLRYDPGQRLGQPPVPGSTLDLQRQRAAQYQSVPIPGVTDIELDIPLATQTPSTQQSSDPGSLIDQGLAASGRFTGEWQVVDNNGRELYRFGGVGNSQGDANRVATRWLAQQGYTYGTEVEVLPIMR